MEGLCLILAILMCFDVQDEVDPLLPLHDVILVCYESQNNELRVSKVSVYLDMLEHFVPLQAVKMI